MSIIMLCSGQGNQKALAAKIHKEVTLDCLVVFKFREKRLRHLNQYTNRLSRAFNALCTFFIYRRVWFGMMRHYGDRYPHFPITPTITTDDINHSSVIDLILRRKPTLVIVSGTNLLKEPLIEAIKKTGAVLNLHTGISPYVKGGPNCTNWCLFNRRFELIGNTIMWLDKGIDSGAIITTERTPLTGRESLYELHLKVMDHAHNLYVRAVCKYIAGEHVPNVPQSSLGDGKLYLGKDWKLKQMLIGLANFYLYFKASDLQFNSSKDVELVDLGD